MIIKKFRKQVILELLIFLLLILPGCASNTQSTQATAQVSTMTGTIDRFEGDYAIVEWNGSEMKDILRTLLPKDSKEGDIIRQRGESYVVDRKETEGSMNEIEELSKNFCE